MSEYLFPTTTGLGDDGGTSGAGAAGALDAAGGIPTSGSFGVDVLCFPDLDAQLRLVGGFALLAQDLLNRLSTPPGGLFYEDSYGYDLRALLNRALDEADVPRISAAIREQCMQDERVADASVTVTLYRRENRLTIGLSVETDEGPFWFVLGVDSVTVELLETR